MDREEAVSVRGSKFEVVEDHKIPGAAQVLVFTSPGYRFSSDLSDSGLGQRDTV